MSGPGEQLLHLLHTSYATVYDGFGRVMTFPRALRKWIGLRTPRGATENAGVENAIRAKLQGWKMQEWKKAGVDSRGGKCRSKLYEAPTCIYIDRILN